MCTPRHDGARPDAALFQSFVEASYVVLRTIAADLRRPDLIQQLEQDRARLLAKARVSRPQLRLLPNPVRM